MSTETQPTLKAPPGTFDCHMHIYDYRFPLSPKAAFKPPEALVPDYLALRKRLGIGRSIVVQPNGYGLDNACTVDAVAKIGPTARGIATVDTVTSGAELARLKSAGMVGARFHMLPGGSVTWDMLAPMAARFAAIGWHVNLQLDGRTLPERVAALRALPCPLVIDHVGKFLEPVPTDHPGFRALLELLATGRVWVKLSAAYEVSKAGPPLYGDVGVLARALVAARPDRMLWASNWPHPTPGTDKPRPNDAQLLDLLLDWAPDDATRRRILVDNPAELYGF